MSYEVWVMLLLLLNTALGTVAVWQRHQTIRKLKADDRFPRVHQPCNRGVSLDVQTINDFFRGVEAVDETGKSSRQDEGTGKDRPSSCCN